MSAPEALKDCLQKLSDDQIESFISKLLDRGDPHICEEQVKGKGYMEVADVMVKTFSERNVLFVAAEVSQEANLKEQADELVKAAIEILKSNPGITTIRQLGIIEPICEETMSANIDYRERDPWSNIHSSEFVKKYKMKLIKNVADPDPLLDLLRHKKVLSDHSYSEMKALPTDVKKMSELLMGPYLENKAACDVFYDFLKKEQPYLVVDLLQN